MVRSRWAFVVSLAVTLAACGDDGLDEDVDATLATVERVRGTVQVGGRATTSLARVARGQKLGAPTNGLARLVLDSGPRMLVGTGSDITLAAPDVITLAAGRVFAEVVAGDRLTITAPAGSLSTNDGSLSAEVRGSTLVFYVVRGDVAWTAGNTRGTAHAGEEITLGSGRATTTPAVLWSDWTGGLARPGPQGNTTPEGMGTLEARVPDELGLSRWPLVIRRLDVSVAVHDDIAITEVSQEFFNPASDTVEGLYRVRVPAGAVLSQFAVDRDGRLVEGFVREQAQARAAYEAQVYRGSVDDPALLEWVAPGSYKAQIYPIPPGATRRIVIRYAEWLTRPGPGAPRLYRYPMGTGASAPHVQELSLAVDLTHAGASSVRAGMGATVEENAVLLRRSDFRPRSDFWLELVDGAGAGATASKLRAYASPYERPRRAPGSRTITNEADEREFLYVPVVLPESLAAARERTGIDVVVVADVSSGTDRSHLELGRSVVESLATHLGSDDRVAIVTSDVALRSLSPEQRPSLGPASRARIESLLEALARAPAGGATDIGSAIGDAASLLDPTRAGIVVYVGDGAPTVGELEAEPLLDRIARLPAPVRLYTVAVGGDANLDLLEALSAGGGLAARVEERSEAADVSLRILAHASRPIAQRVTFDMGTTVDGVYPRRAVDVVLGEPLSVLGRVRGVYPRAIVVRGTIAGRPFTQRFDLEARKLPVASGDLRLRWANERLRHLLLDGAGREAVAELGTRYGLITPYTSYYVPSARELREMGESASLLLHRDLGETPDDERASTGPGVAARGGVFAFIALTACRSNESVLSVAAPSGPASPSPVAAASQPEAEEADRDDRARATADEGASAGGARAQTGQAAAANTAIPDAVREQLARLGYAPSTAPAQPTGATTTPTIPPAVAAPTPAAAPSAPPAADPAAPAEMPAAGGESGAFRLGAGFGSGGGAAGGGGQSQQRVVQAQPASRPMPMRRGRSSDAPLAGLDLAEAGGGSTGDDYGDADRTRRSDREGARTHASLEQNAEVRERRAQSEGWFDANQHNDSPDDATTEEDAANRPTDPSTGRWSNDQGVVGEDGEEEGERERIVIQIERRPRVRCSDASRLSLEDRRALWTERIGAAGGVSEWVAAYRRAGRECELPGWRDRRAFLDIVLERAGSIGTMVDLYRRLARSGAAGHLPSAILRRIHSPADLRTVRVAFGLSTEPDWPTIERLLREATDDSARIRILRQLVRDYPANMAVKLRMLATLERARRIPEARRLADVLRADPLADATVRTEIGEMFLRLGERDEARRAFSEIVELAPMDAQARRRLGDLYRAHGWFEEAYRQYRTLAFIRPDDPTVSLLLAQAAAGAGRVDEALRLEQTVVETAEPGSSSGLARVAMLWSSVRFAKLRRAARGANDARAMSALLSRMRRSGVLREAGALRVSLVWAHPDAGLALWTAYPGASLARPRDLAPELGIEAFETTEPVTGVMRIEVRRSGSDLRTAMEGELVLVWNEGREDERIEVVALRFEPARRAMAWTLEGTSLRETAPSPAPAVVADARGARQAR